MAMVMAGTGDVSCLQRLRYAHGKYSTPNKYGMHLANHMALGLLFLGGGRYTLGTSNIAICSFIIAFYPRWPLFAYDNRFHLQALRHIWVLGVEPRCLITRDVETRKVIYLPVKVRAKDSDGRVGSLQLMAPTLTHDFESILSLRIDSPRYWPVYIDYEQYPHFRQALIRHQTLWVKRRRGYLGYLEDPQSTRSNFVRSSGGATGDVITLEYPELLDENEQGSRDFSEFMMSFRGDDQVTSFADHLCSLDSGIQATGMNRAEKTWVAYCQAALIDCFAADKPQMLPAYIMLHWLRSQQLERSGRFSASLSEIDSLREWYTHTSMKRPELLRRQVIESVFNSTDEKLFALRTDQKFMRQLSNYVNGKGMGGLTGQERKLMGRKLAFYLSRTHTPSAFLLPNFRALLLETLQTAKQKKIPPEAITSIVRMLMGRTAGDALGLEWRWQAVDDVLISWKDSVKINV